MKDQSNKKLIQFILSCGGIGFIPFAPGTMGSLLAIILLYFFKEINLLPFLIIIGIIFTLSIPLINYYEKNWQDHDAKWIVIDELAGQWLCYAFILEWKPWVLAASFILFRFFDILKPSPIKQIDQKLKGGIGVMLDDIIAGVFAGIILLAIQYFIFPT